MTVEAAQQLHAEVLHLHSLGEIAQTTCVTFLFL